ncbi:MAG: TIGR02646 family protein [Crocosphaera sp.]|nr:TIGR02646 family protein [Crocosphaera sp.]
MKYINKQQKSQSLSDYNQKKRQEGDHNFVLLTILLLIGYLGQNQSCNLLILSILQLSKHYQQIRPKYKKYPNKNDLREALLKEQGYICCYCLGRIEIDSMSIEHWLPKSKFNVLETDYHNLLGCCQGGGSAKNPNKNRHHCGVMKADKIIKINPTDTNFEDLIQYDETGEIYSTDQQINQELTEILNLNIVKLVDERRQYIVSIQKVIEQEIIESDDPQLLIDQLYPLLEEGEDKYEPYCMIEVGYLRHLIINLYD